MFYQEQHGSALRFGDVVLGFISATPTITNLLLTYDSKDYKIDISKPNYFVILSPCCSIRDKVILLTPLLPVRISFFDNPYFSEDLTNINRIMEPEKKFAPSVWEGLPPDRTAKEKLLGVTYTNFEVFIYAENERLEKYCLKNRSGENIQTGYYLIDFRYSFRVNCEKIVAPETSPRDTKLLQLTPHTRKELREKIAHFYGRLPDEDKPFLEAE